METIRNIAAISRARANIGTYIECIGNFTTPMSTIYGCMITSVETIYQTIARLCGSYFVIASYYQHNGEEVATLYNNNNNVKSKIKMDVHSMITNTDGTKISLVVIYGYAKDQLTKILHTILHNNCTIERCSPTQLQLSFDREIYNNVSTIANEEIVNESETNDSDFTLVTIAKLAGVGTLCTYALFSCICKCNKLYRSYKKKYSNVNIEIADTGTIEIPSIAEQAANDEITINDEHEYASIDMLGAS